MLPLHRRQSLKTLHDEIVHRLNDDPEVFQIFIDAADHPEQFMENGECLLTEEKRAQFRRLGEEGLARLQSSHA